MEFQIHSHQTSTAFEKCDFGILQRYAADSKCPPLDEEAFSILEIILPTLQLFQTITLEYSKAQVTVHRILPDLNYAIKELERLQALSGVSPAKKVSFAAAIARLKIYFLQLPEQ